MYHYRYFFFTDIKYAGHFSNVKFVQKKRENYEKIILILIKTHLFVHWRDALMRGGGRGKKELYVIWCDIESQNDYKVS